MRVFLLFIALTSSTLVVASTRCIAGDCSDGKGRAIFSNGDKYAGAWKAGQMHGDGIYSFRSGAVYRGTFFRGKIEGKGTVRYPDGAYFVGQWKNNKKHGQGRLVRPSGKAEVAVWRNGKRVARANDSNTLASSSSSSSSFRENQRVRPASSSDIEAVRNCNTVFCENGNGRYTYRDGSVYEGEFEEGQPSGEGVLRYANGDVYAGGWYNNGPDGKGHYVFANGKKISGQWSNGSFVKRTYQDNQTGESEQSEGKTKPSSDADGKATMYAVVVGIGAYDAMQTLNFTDDDAYQMYAFLKSPEGGALTDEQVEILIDERATKVNIEQALQDKLAKADADDIVVFYYSGHGVDGYFVPVDFDGINNLLSHNRVEQLLASSSAKHKLVLADACHSGGLLAAKSATTSIERLYDAFSTTSGGTALMLSSKSTEISLEARNLRSGVYSHFLMRGMKGEADTNGNRIVTVSELHNFLFDRVRDYTGRRQTPILTGSFDSDMPVSVLR